MLLQDLSFYDVANYELVHTVLPESFIVIVSKYHKNMNFFILITSAGLSSIKKTPAANDKYKI